MVSLSYGWKYKYNKIKASYDAQTLELNIQARLKKEMEENAAQAKSRKRTTS